MNSNINVMKMIKKISVCWLSLLAVSGMLGQISESNLVSAEPKAVSTDISAQAGKPVHATLENLTPSTISYDEIDVVSNDTLGTGTRSFSWDLTDETGERVLDEVYTVKVEGTLYWQSSILFSSQVDIGSPISGDFAVTEIRNEPDTQENADIIDNVRFDMVS